MANPRKFSEKIALHNQKQAEETAAFEKIMREVSDATNKVNSSSRHARTKALPPEPIEIVESALRSALSPQGLGSYRSGSLPNVAAPQVASTEAETIKPEETTLATQYGLGARSGGASPSRAPGQRGRTSSSVGPMRRPADRKHDTSPYGSTVYLSPPPDSNWRRTHSDSALHQSCEQTGAPPLSPHHHPHMPAHNHRGNIHLDVLGSMGMNPNSRPRSSCEIPRIPNNNNVYGAGEGGGGGGASLSCGELQVPGGSLPDLTSVHFPPAHYRNNDYHRYSPTSPVGSVSPATGGLSPASGSPVGATVPHALHPHEHAALYDAQNHLSVPNTNNYLHRNKNMSPLEHGLSNLGYHSHCSPPSQCSSASNINVPSPTMVNSPGSPVESPQSDYSNLHAALLQPFEQITMLDYPVTTYSSTYSSTYSTTYSSSYMNHSTPHSPLTTSAAHTYPQTSEAHSSSGGCGSRCGARDPVAGGGAYSLPSPPPRTPATPASIPDIILTDFDRVTDYTGELDAGIFGGEEAQLRAGLDLDDLTLLEEPSALLPDSAVEHAFRLDRL